MSKGTGLVKYDTACRALAAARSVDEVKDIRDKAVAMQAYAKQAKDRTLVEDATEIRLRAERRAGELLREMEKNKGAVRGKTGRKGKPVLDGKPKLKDLGVNKTQSSRWQALAAIPQNRFEAVVAVARGKVNRAVRNAVREAELEQERGIYRARTEQGCTIDDLEALAASGKKFGVICPDFPWPFEAYSREGNQRSAEAHYDTWPMEKILAMGALVERLAADDCALLLWAVWPRLPDAMAVITACGFEYKSAGFVWLKTDPKAEGITLDGKGLHLGMGISGPRSNTEPLLLATKGNPLRLVADVHQVVIAPVGEHSAKPDEVYRRIERLYPGPYLELFARRPRARWTVWGDEIPRQQLVAAE
jgi:N6-adenosine-specific RNA methylase IME4